MRPVDTFFIEELLKTRGGGSSCPAQPYEKYRAFARWGKLEKNSLTSKLAPIFLQLSLPCER